jgi:uncharacterized membrane protein YcgQ (UPF0703/DUF1980 family)
MKKCTNCGFENSDYATECSSCNTPLSAEDIQPKLKTTYFQDIMQKFHNSSYNTKKVITVSALVLAFILGNCTHMLIGVKRSDYRAVVQRLNKSTETIKSKKEEYDSLQAEYTSYKNKMQPYEDIQLADAQNKIEQDKIKAEQDKQALAEKKAAEEKAAAEAKAQKEAEEQAAAEAKAAEEAKGYETGITFDNLARTPNEYKGKKVKFTGKVVQVLEGTSETQIRLAINGNYDKIIYCRVPKEKTSATRILEDDYIHILGVSNGLISYQSTMGGTITIPDVSVHEWGPS